MKADRLGDAAIADALDGLHGWARDGDEIVRRVRCAGWRAAIRLVDAVAEAAERRDHHPDVCITGYRHVAFRLTTHSEGGITHRDIDLARDIDRLVAEHTPA